MNLFPIHFTNERQTTRTFQFIPALNTLRLEWLVQLRDGKGPKFDKVKDAMNGRGGLVKAVNLAGPFIMSSQGKP